MDILQFLFYVIFFTFVFLCTFIYATYSILSQMSKPSKQFKTSSWRESSDSKLISPRNFQIYESCCECEIDHSVYWLFDQFFVNCNPKTLSKKWKKSLKLMYLHENASLDKKILFYQMDHIWGAPTLLKESLLLIFWEQ